MLDDPFIDRVWILLVLSLAGSLLCFYLYKLCYVIIPIIGIVSAIFLRHFLEPETYGRIEALSHAMPRLLFVTISSFVLPLIATYFHWRRLRHKTVMSASELQLLTRIEQQDERKEYGRSQPASMPLDRTEIQHPAAQTLELQNAAGGLL